MRYWSGFFSRASMLVVFGLFLFGINASAEAMAAMYADMGARLPAATALVLHPAWRYGMPLLGGLAVAGFNFHSAITEHRRAMFLGVLAFLPLNITGFECWAHYMPLFELSDAVSLRS